MANDRLCKICGKAVTPERLARYPVAVLCGSADCNVIHARRRSKANQERMRADYFAWRRATGKLPAEREPVAAPRGLVDTFLGAIRRDSASGALRRLGMM